MKHGYVAGGQGFLLRRFFSPGVCHRVDPALWYNKRMKELVFWIKFAVALALGYFVLPMIFSGFSFPGFGEMPYPKLAGLGLIAFVVLNITGMRKEWPIYMNFFQTKMWIKRYGFDFLKRYTYVISYLICLASLFLIF